MLLFILTVVSVGVFALWLSGLGPGPPPLAADVALLATGGTQNSISVTFEHRGGESVRLDDLAVQIAWKDMSGIVRTYRTDSGGGGVTVTMTTEPVSKTRFELGDNLRVTFNLSGYTYNPAEYASVWLIYRPANQVLIAGRYIPGAGVEELVYDDFEDGSLGTNTGGIAGSMAPPIEVGQIPGYKDAFFSRMWLVNIIFDNENRAMKETVDIDNIEFIKAGTPELMFCSFEIPGSTDTGGSRGCYNNFYPSTPYVRETDIVGDRVPGEKQLKLEYNRGNSYCGYFMKSSGGSELDISAYNTLKLYAKGSANITNVKLEMKSATGNGERRINLPTSWTEITISFSQFSGFNPARFTEMVITFDTSTSPQSATAYFDDIKFTVASGGADDVTKYDDFDDGEHDTNLGGSAGVASYDGSHDPVATFVGSGNSYFLRLSVDLDKEWCGYYMYATDTNPASPPRENVNAKDNDNISVMVRGSKGGENFKIEIKDAYENAVSIYATQTPGFGQITTSWKKLSIPLTKFRHFDNPRLSIVEDSGSRWLRVDYSYYNVSGNWCGYYSSFRSDWSGYDVSGYAHLKFRLRGGSGGENFKIEIKDTSGGMWSRYLTQFIGFSGGLPTSPQELDISLSTVTGVNLSSLKEIDITFDTSPRQGTVYIDKIWFTK